jgi:hypothetical protein
MPPDERGRDSLHGEAPTADQSRVAAYRGNWIIWRQRALSQLREELFHNFAVRMALDGGSFTILCLSVLFLRTDVVPSR